MCAFLVYFYRPKCTKIDKYEIRTNLLENIRWRWQCRREWSCPQCPHHSRCTVPWQFHIRFLKLRYIAVCQIGALYPGFFIGPRSDHSLPMSVTHWLTDSLTHCRLVNLSLILCLLPVRVRQPLQAYTILFQFRKRKSVGQWVSDKGSKFDWCNPGV